ncbi:ACT domain-containing protein [Nocardioides pantholopis]|uniref:ACT domain-containing protein n=1 Tax=Nocardioides pantholopis TaxID=2483798 RepID=UPI000FD8D5D6|nr:ACT domain-containing protein [Nocardioides pantholopis]
MSTPEQESPQVADQSGAEAPTSADRPTYTLQEFPERLAVVRLAPGSEIPAWAESSSIFSVTATATETSVVCAGRNVPTKAVSHKPLTGFAVKGPLDLELVGVLAELLAPLAEARISVFTLSTFDTDWILVPQRDAEKAAEAWRRRGHTVAPAVPAKPARAASAKGAPSRKQTKSK